MAKQENSKKLESGLPTNIEEVTADYVRDNLASWDEQILARRTKSLRIPAEAAANIEDKPLFIVEAEERARAEKRSLSSVLQQYSEELRASQYPTGDCLLPDEVAEYVETGKLPAGRLEHTKYCRECAALMDASRPDRSIPQFAHLRRKSDHRPAVSIMTKLATVLLPALSILVGTYLILTRVDSGAASQTAPSSPMAWVVAACGFFVYLVGYRGLQSLPTLRSLVNGVVVGSVVSGFVYIDFMQSRATSQIAFQWARDRAESLVLSAMEQQLATGRFPGAEEASAITTADVQSGGKLNIATSTISNKEATYTVTVPDFRWKIVADMHADGGKVTVEGGNKELNLQSFLGTVASDNSGAQSSTEKGIRAQNGTFYRVASQSDFVLAPGTRVFAVVDPSTSYVEKYRPIVSAKEPGSLNSFKPR